MGTNQFLREYIEYLQEKNTDLLKKLNNLQKNYENNILAKDFKRHCLISALEEVLNVCTEIPQEIDFFFDKMTAAMSALKSILLRKSKMVQLVEKISKVINPIENIDNNLLEDEDLDLMKEQMSESRAGRKGGTVRVSPMINGHVISTEPRIYLSRVHGVYSSERENNTQLSPIVEASPNTSSDPSNPESHVFREIKIPLERINLNKMSYISEESPKSRFKGPKTWKKSLSSNICQSDQLQKNCVFLENNENLNKKFSVGEVELPQNMDPLEGPSWLYEELPEMNSSSSHFIDYRRRKHRFATVFDKNEDSVNYFEKSNKSLGEDSNEFYEDKNDKNLEENRKRISESSEDFICESFNSESEEYTSPKKRKCHSKRMHAKESICKNDAKLEDIKKKKSLVRSKNKSIFNSPIKSESSDDENNEEHFIRQLSEKRKRSLKSLYNKSSREMPFERTPIRTQHFEQENPISERRKSKERRGTPIKDLLKCDAFVKLENCHPSAKFTPKKSKAKSPSAKKKSEKSKSKSKSKSPKVSLPEKEGRIRRKAAPTFKLVEPKLGTKLRRS